VATVNSTLVAQTLARVPPQLLKTADSTCFRHRDSFAFVLHPLAQVEALEELMDMEDPGDSRTTAPRVLWEHRKIEKLLNGFVAVSAWPSLSLRWEHENELPIAYCLLPETAASLQLQLPDCFCGALTSSAVSAAAQTLNPKP